MTRYGYITTDSDQGAEGRVEFVFVDTTLESRNEPPFIYLTNGQRLRIENVWEGVINLVPVGTFDKPPASTRLWSETKQKDVPYAAWLSWFTQNTPLRAELNAE